MTNEEKRDLLVNLAERVMNARCVYKYEGAHCSYKFETPDGSWLYIDNEMTRPKPWNPMENIADAWMLVEALRKKDCAVVVTGSGVSSQSACYVFSAIWSIGRRTNDVPEYDHRAMYGYSVQDSVPLAICLAADAATRGAA